MRGMLKKTAALFTAVMLGMSCVPQTLAENGVYENNAEASAQPYTAQGCSCDFMQLVKDNADTYYGNAEDIIRLDDHTTAALTYEGTYVSADGKVYIKSGTTCNDDGKYKKGSYISFTAPSDGTLYVHGSDIGWFEEEAYKGFGGDITAEVKAGVTYHFGWRKASTYIDELTFTPSETPDTTPSPTPDTSGDGIDGYVSPSTTWDFNAAGPAADGTNKPVISGSAEYDATNGEVKFPFTTTESGALKIELDTPIKATPKDKNTEISFTVMNHVKPRSGCYFSFKALNSEGEEIVYFETHPYSFNQESYPVDGLVIGGVRADDGEALRSAGFGSQEQDIPVTVKIDYYARKASVTVGETEFSGNIPESAVQDIKTIQFEARRTATEGSRYMSLDDIEISEFTSAEEPAPAGEIANGYDAAEYEGMPYRIARPGGSGEYPLVVYLHSAARNGTDNVGQLYQAQYLFNELKDAAIAAAPQTENNWDAEKLGGLAASIENVNKDKIYIAGQKEGADAALAAAAEKPGIAGVIAIEPSAELSAEQLESLKEANTAVYVFAEYANAGTARKLVNSMQSSGMTDVLYTEYPFEEGAVPERAASAEGLSDWLFNQSLSENAAEKTEERVVDLAIFMGQSNMAGRGDYEEAVPCLPGHGFEYHPVTEPGVLTTVSEPFGKYENNDSVNDNGGNGVDRRSGDMVSSFIESYYAVSGTPLVGVQCSRGGTESKWWNNETRLNEATARYNEAKEYLEASGYTIGKRFMVWCQGCADADYNRSIESYKENTVSIFNTMKANTGLTDMFMIRIGHCKTSGAAAIDTLKDPRYKAINLAQKELADEVDGITAVASFYTDEYAALMRDQYHYHQAAYNSIGDIAGSNTAYTLYNKGKWTDYPEPEPDIPSTPMPVEGVFEKTSSETEIDVAEMRSYETDTYRVYKTDGSYETVTAENNKIQNTAGGEVTVVPEYRFEFTNQENPTDENIAGYVKAGENSYSGETGFGLLDGDYEINENGCRVDELPIKVDLAGGFYDVTVYRRGGCRADIYSGGKLIANNTTSSGTQNRGGSTALMEIPALKLSDGSIDLTFGNTSGSSERIASVKIARVPEKYRKPVIWVAGDSESSNYYPIDNGGSDLDSDKIMITGFGQQLSKVLSDKYDISNYGQPSATVKTWYDECFDSVESLMRDGDTLIMDFGINDSISSSNGISKEEMMEYMSDIITSAKAKGVTPILVSPIYSGKYQHRSYFTYNAENGTNDMYEFAKEQGVDCIDLNKWTQLYVNDAVNETGDEKWRKNNYHVDDDLHMTQHTALLAASFIAAGMSELGYETSGFEYTYHDISEVLEGNIRGAETGVTRSYGAEAAKEFMGISKKRSVSVSYDKDASALTLTANYGAESAAVIKASYNGDGTMKNVKLHTAEFKDKTAVINGVSLDKGDRIFVWDSIKGMVPLSEVFEYAGEPEVTPSPAPTDEPAEIIYEQDFESFEEVSKGDESVADGWISPAGTVSVKTDGTDGINKYLTVTGGNASRSGYFELAEPVSGNFVFEADFRSVKTSRVSELQLVETRKSVYENHGVENTKKYAFTMDRPVNENLYVINNGVSDSGLSLDKYNQPPVVTDEIEGDPWLHVKVVGNFDEGVAAAKITSLDGKTEYYCGVTDMSEGIKSFECIHLLGPTKDKDVSIDNIKIYKARESDLNAEYHSVNITCKSYTFDQYVFDGKSVVNIPDVSAYGEYFEGWSVNGELYTSEELASLPITADCKIEGVVSGDYIEAMANVSFNVFPAGNELVMGADENTFGSNAISLTITGEQGTSLVSNPDERVTDFDVEWIFDGFRTLDGRPTGESGNSYCEGYGELEETAEHGTAVDFKLKRTAANYWGRVTAKVTYSGKTLEISEPLVILGDKSGQNIIPKAGYASDYNKYEDTLLGYRLAQNDIVFGGWQSYGSDSGYMDFKSDETGKFLSFSRAASGNSMVMFNEIGDITSQTVFEQDIRFGIDGAVSYVGGGSMTAPDSTAFSLEKSGKEIKFNNAVIYDNADPGTWYHIVIHADPTSKKCFAKIYNTADDYGAAEPIAQSGITDFNEYTSGSAYRITLAKSRNASIDINNVNIYEAEVDEAAISVTAPETAEIPESGQNTVMLSAAAKTTDGSAALGMPEWEITDAFADGVSIAQNGAEAVLTISSGASSGYLPVRVTIGGVSKTFNIKLAGTRESIAFTEAPEGIRTGNDGEYKFTAVVRNGMAEEIPERAVSYALTDENGAAADINGVSINGSGMLSVSADALPQTVYITASAENSDGETITRRIGVVLYSLDFVFGTNARKEGFTSVPANGGYSAGMGFGVDGGEETDGGLTGGTFKLKVENGKVYEVTAKYSGTVTCERINSSFTGFTRSSGGETADTFLTAVFGDGVLDIEIDGTLETLSVSPVEKTPSEKPDWWTIGDSTIQQNGAWAHTLEANGLAEYPELDEAIDAFHNSGRAGRQHKNFYSEGLLNSILTQMNPGDVVSLSNMGTNDSSSTLEQFKEYDEIYMNAIIDMGGYVILGSYTPSGNYGETAGKVYDYDTMTFKGMRTNAYDRAIRELYEENKDNPKVLGFLDVGQMCDEIMTADVRGVYESAQGTEEEKRAAANARAEEMMTWWRDYNHYNSTFSNYILPYITAEAAELINKIK